MFINTMIWLSNNLNCIKITHNISDYHIANKKLATYFYFGKCQKCIKCILVIKCTNSTMQINLFIYKYEI